MVQLSRDQREHCTVTSCVLACEVLVTCHATVSDIQISLQFKLVTAEKSLSFSTASSGFLLLHNVLVPNIKRTRYG
jgi:hypothetical protein